MIVSENGIYINFWTGEMPFKNCDDEVIEKSYESDKEGLNCDKEIAVEVRVNRDVNNYGLLGVKYYRVKSGARVIINICDDMPDNLYKENISLRPDIVHRGIPKEYAIGIEKSFDMNCKKGILKCGIYKFSLGAYGEIGSSENIFFRLTNILLRVLYADNCDEKMIKQIVDEEFCKNYYKRELEDNFYDM